MGAESESGRAAPRQPTKTLLLVLGAGVLALAGSFVILERNRLFPAPKVDAPGTGTPLQLTVESQGSGLNIRWNPQSEPVVKAREGRLVIKEGDQRVQTLLFDPQQLKTGYIYYESPAERLEFQMEIVDAAGAVVKASVMALPSRTPVAPVAEPPPKTRPEPAPETPEPPRPSRAAARPFLPPPSGQRATEPSRVIALEPPANLPSAFISPGVSLPSATSSLAGLAVQGPRASQPIKVGGNLQAANLVKRVTPVYPPLAKSSHIQGTVRFTALIAKDGTVQNLQLISGHPVLVQAAADAVKRWVYRPTLLNGEPTEVITQIEVNFTL
jgi:periplasmic protein TonB